MDLYDSQQLAIELMTEHGLIERGWVFRWDRAKRRAGCCSFGKRTIQLSMPMTRLHTPDLVRDSILHEIAHALVGPAHGHDAHWRAKCREVGALPQRCVVAYNEAGERVAKVAATWVGTCAYGHTNEYYRAPQRVSSCTRCTPYWSDRHLFSWTKNGKQMSLEDMPKKYQEEMKRIMTRKAARERGEF